MAEGSGTVKLLCETSTGESLVTLQNVMYVPGMAANLVSVSRATAAGAKAVFVGECCQLEVDGEVVLEARKSEGIYVINQAKGLVGRTTSETGGDEEVSETVREEPEGDACFLVKKPETAELWHRRMGHAGYENLAKMVQGDLVKGVGVGPSAFRALKTSVCEPCIMGKQTRLPFPESESVSTEPLELVHMDVCGPMPVASKGGSRYFATFLDDYSKLSVVVPMKQKGQVAKVAEHVLNRLEVQSGKKLKTVRTDRGKEYVNKALEEVLGGKGTVHEKTAPYSAEQNGSAERLNRVLEEKIRAMLEDSGLPKEMWAEAVVTANYTRNRTPVSAHGKTPWEAFFGEKPSVGHMRVFGARAFMHVPKQKRRKLEPVSERGVFVGYEPDSKAYRILRESDGKILISRDVIFDEGDGGSGVVELDSDPADGSPTAEADDAAFPKPVEEGPVLETVREDPAAAPAHAPAATARTISKRGQSGSRFWKRCGRLGPSRRTSRKTWRTSTRLVRGIPPVRDGHQGSGTALT